MRTFRRTRAGISARLTAPDVAILRMVIDQVLEILAPAGAAADPLVALTGMALPPAPDPTSHPVLARLFPDAYRDDPVAAEAFRVLSHGTLAADKRDTLVGMLADLPEEGDPAAEGATVRLDLEAAERWLRGLNDLRLTLGTTLNVDADWEDQWASLEQDDPEWFTFAVYDRLTVLQGALLEVLGN